MTMGQCKFQPVFDHSNMNIEYSIPFSHVVSYNINATLRLSSTSNTI